MSLDTDDEIPDELLPDSATAPAGTLWWRLQLVGGGLLTAIGLLIWVLHYGLGWSSDRIGDAMAAVLEGMPAPPSIWFGVGLISLALPVVATYMHARELSRRGAEVRVWAWALTALVCVNVWPLYWLLVWIAHRYQQEVSE